MKKLALALTAAMALVAVPLATSHAATSAQPVLAQSGDMTDVSSHGRYWRHRYYRHHVFFYHRPYYRHYGWYRPHYRHYGWYRGHHYGWRRHYAWWRGGW